MTQTVSALTWQDTADPAAPIAPYTINFQTDPNWQYQLAGTYHQTAISPAGVMVDNTAGPQPVTVAVGPVTVNVGAQQRQNIIVPPNTSLVSFTSTGKQSISVEFYRTPPQSPQVPSALAQQTGTSPPSIPLTVISLNEIIGAGGAVSGVITGFNITMSVVGGAAIATLITSEGAVLWTGRIVAEAGVWKNIAVTMSGLWVPFNSYVQLNVIASTATDGYMNAAILYVPG